MQVHEVVISSRGPQNHSGDHKWPPGHKFEAPAPRLQAAFVFNISEAGMVVRGGGEQQQSPVCPTVLISTGF